MLCSFWAQELGGDMDTTRTYLTETPLLFLCKPTYRRLLQCLAFRSLNEPRFWIICGTRTTRLATMMWPRPWSSFQAIHRLTNCPKMVLYRNKPKTHFSVQGLCYSEMNWERNKLCNELPEYHEAPAMWFLARVNLARSEVKISPLVVSRMLWSTAAHSKFRRTAPGKSQELHLMRIAWTTIGRKAKINDSSFGPDLTFLSTARRSACRPCELWRKKY